jgi:cytochrome P450
VFIEIPTFLAAGLETASVSLSWTLYVLAQRPDVQARLHHEVCSLTLSTDASGCPALSSTQLADLENLPLLDAVVRETLRLYPAVPNALRVAVQDDVLPLLKPITNQNGRTEDSLRVAKGDQVFIPSLAINRLPQIWGSDAGEWKYVHIME